MSLGNVREYLPSPLFLICALIVIIPIMIVALHEREWKREFVSHRDSALASVERYHAREGLYPPKAPEGFPATADYWAKGSIPVFDPVDIDGCFSTTDNAFAIYVSGRSLFTSKGWLYDSSSKKWIYGYLGS